MEKKRLFSTMEIAKILGISRIAVFKRIKTGDIKATKVGRNYVISDKILTQVLGKKIRPGRGKSGRMGGFSPSGRKHPGTGRAR